MKSIRRKAPVFVSEKPAVCVYQPKKIAGSRPKMTGAQRQLDFFSLFWAEAQRLEGAVMYTNCLFLLLQKQTLFAA